MAIGKGRIVNWGKGVEEGRVRNVGIDCGGRGVAAIDGVWRVVVSSTSE